MDTEVHPPLSCLPTLKYSSCILTIVLQLVDILMLVASYFSDSTCSGSNRESDIHSKKDIEIWIALLNSRDKNHFDVSHQILYTHKIVHRKLMYSISHTNLVINMSPNPLNFNFIQRNDTVHAVCDSLYW